MRALSVVALALMFAGPRSVHAQQLTCPPPDAAAGNGALVGRVLDVPSGVPLGFTLVELRLEGREAPVEARADARGWFRFCDVAAGTLTLVGRIGQRERMVGPLLLPAGEITELVLDLSPPEVGRDTGTLTGVVVDALTGEPVEGATLTVPERGLSALSNALGRFTFPSILPGMVELQATRLGYAPSVGEVGIEVGKSTDTKVSLNTEPIAMEPILVTAVRRRIALPDIDDFERRFHSGWGRFVLEEDIQRRSPMLLTDVLQTTGLDIGPNGTSIAVRRTGCAPLVYMDGVRTTHLSRSGPRPRTVRRGATYVFPDPEASPEQEAAYAVNLANPQDVLAVEVYSSRAEAPGIYAGPEAQCGVILIWTKRGRDRR